MVTVLPGFKLTQDGTTLRDVHVRFKTGAGIIGNVAGGYIDDFLLEDSVISGDPDVPGIQPGHPNWGEREYNLRRAMKRRVIYRNIEKEHGSYFSHAGDVTFDGCQFWDLGSQGIQSAQREMDLIGGRADNVQCVLRVVRCHFERCATIWGRRQSWNLTIFAFDENKRDAAGNLILDANGKPMKGVLVPSKTDVEIAGCIFNGYGYPHLASGNRQCDSTGAILVQDRENCDIRRCHFRFQDPDREVIQLRNIKNAFVGSIELWGGDLVLHDMDNNHVDIKPGTGDGWIRRRAPGSHTSTKICPITAGYSH